MTTWQSIGVSCNVPARVTMCLSLSPGMGALADSNSFWRLWRDSSRRASLRGLLAGPQYFGDRVDELAPGGRFGAQLLSAARCQRVELGAAVVLGELPLRLDPAPFLETVQGGVERSFADGQHLAGELLDP